MNSGAVTAFLPNFPCFTSPWGLRSSTVQPAPFTSTTQVTKTERPPGGFPRRATYGRGIFAETTVRNSHGNSCPEFWKRDAWKRRGTGPGRHRSRRLSGSAPPRGPAPAARRSAAPAAPASSPAAGGSAAARGAPAGRAAAGRTAPAGGPAVARVTGAARAVGATRVARVAGRVSDVDGGAGHPPAVTAAAAVVDAVAVRASARRAAPGTGPGGAGRPQPRVELPAATVARCPPEQPDHQKQERRQTSQDDEAHAPHRPFFPRLAPRGLSVR